ncbi:MAG TPA: hypothetical protein VF173_16200 [Thermoanaerobaculia bacterium]|nr:hypothetical protein [Thermoanaerobaculia bacterium]
MLQIPVLAMVDTAAPWCIFTSRIGEVLRKAYDPISDRIWLSTRLGTFVGQLYKVPITFPAQEGVDLKLDATVFVSPDWQGDNFLGYQGVLERIRFAVDPERNRFYFGELG